MKQSQLIEKNKEKKRLEIALETFEESITEMDKTLNTWLHQLNNMQDVLNGIRSRL